MKKQPQLQNYGGTPPTRAQPTGCEMCKGPPNGEARKYAGFVRDHCHSTGLFRGWLCSVCNSRLGYWCDDLASAVKLHEFTASAVRYFQWVEQQRVADSGKMNTYIDDLL